MLRSQGMGSMWWQSELPRHLDMGGKGGLYNNATHITTPNATLYGFRRWPTTPLKTYCLQAGIVDFIEALSGISDHPKKVTFSQVR